MKRFLINLIATTLLLIIAFSSFGCTDNLLLDAKARAKKRQELFIELDKVSLETNGYELIFIPDKYISSMVESDGDVVNDNFLKFTFNNQNYFKKVIGEYIEQSGLIQSWSFYYDYSLIFYKENNEDNKTILNTNFIKERSVSANNILSIFETFNKPLTFAPIDIIEFDNKLFIFCLGVDTMGGYQMTNHILWTPSMIFEYDIEKGSVKYAGYLKTKYEYSNRHAKIQKTN